MTTMPCACGGHIDASWTDPMAGVLAHVETRRHRAYSDRWSWFPRTTAVPTARSESRDVSATRRVRPVLRRRPRGRLVPR